MNLFKITLLSSSLFLFACSKEAPQENINEVPATPVETPTVQTATPQIQPETTTNMPSVYTQDNAGVQINPPHGQPGHDCAVPVGAPLPNSGTSAPQEASSIMHPMSAPEGVALNPPHGQPGHDCAVPVGAPLNN